MGLLVRRPPRGWRPPRSRRSHRGPRRTGARRRLLLAPRQPHRGVEHDHGRAQLPRPPLEPVRGGVTAMAKVVVLGTGGTIASRRAAAGGGATSKASSAELVAALGERGYRLPDGVTLETEQFCTIGSYRFDLDIAFRIARRVAQHLADPAVAGVVVTQGTDTMEESA